eukprot:3251893-Amphidinium_carterae.1
MIHSLDALHKPVFRLSYNLIAAALQYGKSANGMSCAMFITLPCRCQCHGRLYRSSHCTYRVWSESTLIFANPGGRMTCRACVFACNAALRKSGAAKGMGVPGLLRFAWGLCLLWLSDSTAVPRPMLDKDCLIEPEILLPVRWPVPDRNRRGMPASPTCA